jgi:phage terminase large subunit-like protein
MAYDPAWDTSCPDWERRLLAGESLVPDLPLFKSEEEKALRVFKRLRVPDLIGMPRLGDVGGPFLFPIVGAIFGAYDPATHVRMINEVFWLMPKKNTKTSSAAAIMVTALILNCRPEAEFVLVSSTKEVAEIAFKQAAGTIRADPELAKVFHIQGHFVRKITHRKTGASLQVKAADTDVVTGGKPVGVLVDEEHVLAAKSDASEIMLELRGGLATRPDGFLIIITTQSKKEPRGIFKADLENARAVRDGKVKQPLLPILYELPKHLSKEWKDRKYWPLLNPNYGRSVRPEFLENELAKYEERGEAELALFASQHFNVQIGTGLSIDGWGGAEDWDACADPTITLESLLDRCEVVVVGIDCGGKDDLFSICVLGREKGGQEVHRKRWLAWGHNWCHRSAIEQRKQNASLYDDFVKARELTVVNQLDEDTRQAVEIIKVVFMSGLLAHLAFDPNRTSSLLDAIVAADIGGDDEFFASITQGRGLGDPAVAIERKLNSGSFAHADQAIMRWAVSNAKVEQIGNSKIITKKASGVAKIDPLIALLNAGYMMGRNPQARVSRSFWDVDEEEDEAA